LSESHAEDQKILHRTGRPHSHAFRTSTSRKSGARADFFLAGDAVAAGNTKDGVSNREEEKPLEGGPGVSLAR